MSKAEKDSIRNLVEETEKTADIAEKLHKCLEDKLQREKKTPTLHAIGKMNLAPVKT